MTATKNTLVVIDSTVPEQHLVQRAGAYASGTDSGLVVLSVMPPREYQARQRAIADVRDLDYEYTYDRAVDTSRNAALRVGNEALADGDVSFQPVGKVGRVRDAILETTREFDCDHVVVAGRRRRIWNLLPGVWDLGTWLERSFPGHVSVYFDNSLVEPDTSSGLDDSIAPPSPTKP